MQAFPLLATSAALALAGAFGAAAQEAAVAADLPPVVAAWTGAWNADDAKAMAALFGPEGVYEDLAFQVAFQGPEGATARVRITTNAVPDARVEVVDAFQSGDRIAVRWTFSGTPVRFADLPASDESFSVPVVTLIEMRGGRIARLTDAYNLADLFRQVGADPSLWVPPAP